MYLRLILNTIPEATMAFASFQNLPESSPAAPKCPIHAWLPARLAGVRPSVFLKRGGLTVAGLFTLAGLKCILLYVVAPAAVAAFALTPSSPESIDVQQMPLRCPVTGHDASAVFAPADQPAPAPAADPGTQRANPPAAR
jgi:hypothetical protein